MAAEEPVTAPDQHRPGATRSARIGAVVVIVALLLMICGTHSWLERTFLILGAGTLAAILIGDRLLRKNGLR